MLKPDEVVELPWAVTIHVNDLVAWVRKGRIKRYGFPPPRNKKIFHGDQLYIWRNKTLNQVKEIERNTQGDVKKKECLFCKKPFQSENSRKLYCSDSCCWKMFDAKHPRHFPKRFIS